jgi:arylsulfatase A-like enzyme
MKRWQLALLLCRGACLISLVGCDASRAPNVVLISVDTLRADALGAYGGPLPTPAFDALARQGVLFERVLAPSSATAPSHATLFSGRDVLRHGVITNGQDLPERFGSIATAFRSRGYATAAFVSSFVLHRRFGWDAGFDHYDSEFSENRASLRREMPGFEDFLPGVEVEGGFDRRGEDTTRAARDWLATAPEPFFLFVHYFDPHNPYTPPWPYPGRVREFPVDLAGRGASDISPARLERLIRMYQAEVLYVDDAIGELVAALDADGRGARTLLAVTADHGEGLGQHGWLLHGLHLYGEQVRVPLLLRWPGQLPAGVRLSTPIGLVDVAPTLADLSGVELAGPVDGRSLAPAVRSGSEPEIRPLFGYRQKLARLPGRARGEKFSVSDARLRYIRSAGAGEELYDLEADPGETRNLVAREAAGLDRMRTHLDRHLAAFPTPPDLPELSDETRRGLEALGYVE